MREQPCENLQLRSRITLKNNYTAHWNIILQLTPATAGLVNLSYKSCPEMAGQDHIESSIVFIYSMSLWCRLIVCTQFHFIINTLIFT